MNVDVKILKNIANRIHIYNIIETKWDLSPECKKIKSIWDVTLYIEKKSINMGCDTLHSKS